MEQPVEQIEKIYQLVTEYLVTYSFQLIAAIVILLIGIWIANRLARVVQTVLRKKEIDITLSIYAAKVIKLLIIIMVAIIALGKLGISVSPFLAAVGAIGLGVGLALQGMLTNYAAGVSIIITRPFVVGDTIEVAGVQGQVKEIELGYTILFNEEGERISIPNKHIIGEIIHNSAEFLLAETIIGVTYDTDLPKAIQLLENTLSQQPQISEETPAIVGVGSFGDSSININVRFWVPTKSYHQDKFAVNLALFQALKQAGIEIPFPQREVRMLQD